MLTVFGLNGWRKEYCDKETKTADGEDAEKLLLKIPRKSVADLL